MTSICGQDKMNFNSKYPAIADLRVRARHRIPKFAFEYLDGGCNEDLNLDKNRSDLQAIQLLPQYLKPFSGVDLRTELFGHTYDAPFGIAPIGLQGLMWPGAPEILAKAAKKHNIPFILSTVSTSSIEKIGNLTEGRFWFQLYHPKEEALRDDLLKRAAAAGCEVLVILCDVPTFGFRPRDIRNGLAMPPKMSSRNVLQIMAKPRWAWHTLKSGKPVFETLRQYMPKQMDIKQLGAFMDQTFAGRLSQEKIAALRDLWKGKLVLKGIASEEDTELAVKTGLDGIILSNHGGRQLDAGPSSISTLPSISAKFGDKIKIMMDSGLRSGPDIARALASGAQFTFMGRSFMYSTCALGKEGGDHMAALLKTQFKQVMEQIGCENPTDLPKYLNNEARR